MKRHITLAICILFLWSTDSPAKDKSEIKSISITDEKTELTIAITQEEYKDISQALERLESLSNHAFRKHKKFLKDNPEAKAGMYISPVRTRFTLELRDDKLETIDYFPVNKDGKLVNILGNEKDKQRVEKWFAKLLNKFRSFGKLE